MWNLPLEGPSFEPLQSAAIQVMTLKTALLLPLASVKRVGDLQAMSVSAFCPEFGSYAQRLRAQGALSSVQSPGNIPAGPP